MTEKVKEQSVSFVKEFMAFVKAFGVIGLALGVVIGNAVNTLTQSLSNNVLTPLIGLLFQSSSFQTYQIGVVKVGAFIDSLINFLILLFIIWITVKLILSAFLSPEERVKLGISSPEEPAEKSEKNR